MRTVVAGVLVATVVGSGPASSASSSHSLSYPSSSRSPVRHSPVSSLPEQAGSAAVGWGPTVAVADHEVSDLRVGADGAGNVFALWRRSLDGTSVVEASRYDAGTRWWGAPVLLSRADEDAAVPDLMVTADGGAVAAWERAVGAERSVVASRFDPAAGVWDAGAVLGTGISRAPSVAVSASGSAVVAWVAVTPEGERFVRAATSTPGGDWSVAHDVAGPLPGVWDVGSAFDGSGDGVVVWRARTADGVYEVQSAVGAGGAWGVPVTVAELPSSPLLAAADLMGVAGPVGGGVEAVWREPSADGWWTVRATHRDAGGGWADPVSLSAAGGHALDVSLAAGRAGGVAAAWSWMEPAGRSAHVAVRQVGGGWSAPIGVAGEGVATAPSVAVGDGGTVAVAWAGGDAAVRAVEIVDGAVEPWPDAAAGGRPVTVLDGALAAGPAGSATAVWVERDDDGPGRVVAATRLEPVGFGAVRPGRLLDTRGPGATVDGVSSGGGPVGAGSVTRLRVAGRGGVPDEALAVGLVVTMVEPAAAGWVSVFPCGAGVPEASSVNFAAGAGAVANSVIVGVGDGGEVCVFSDATADVLIDVTSWFGEGLAFGAVRPGRLLDTRGPAATVDGVSSGGGPVGAGSVTRLRVAGRGGVPDDAVAVGMVVTVVDADRAGWVSVFPCGVGVPEASSVNFAEGGGAVANSVVVGVGDGGEVCVYSDATAEVLVDVTSWFGEGLAFGAVRPGRLLDTRGPAATVDGVSSGGGPVRAGSVTRVRIPGRGGVPDEAVAVGMVVTVVEPADAGFVSVFPCGTGVPEASSVNFAEGVGAVANSVIVGVGAGGEVCVFSDAAADVLMDVTSWFG